MSSESLQIVRAIHEAWARGASAGKYLSPEIEYVNPPDAVEPGTRTGRQTFSALREVYPDLSVTPLEFHEVEGAIVVPVQLSGHASSSDVGLTWELTYVWWVENGLAVRFAWFQDRESAFEMARVKPG